MNDLEKQLKECSQEIRESYLLKKEERIRIANNILSKENHTTPIASPYHKVRFPHFLFMNYASIALVFVLMFTGFVSYVADQALPGDPLYAVKTHVNENIQSLLTFSPSSQAELQVSLTKKRLGEAQTLVIDDRMSTSTEQALAIDFKQHLDNFKSSIDEINSANAVSGDASSTAISGDASSTLIISLDDVEKQSEDQLKTLTPDQVKTLAYGALQDVSVAIDGLDTLNIFASSTFQISTPSDSVASSTASTTPVLVATSTDASDINASTTASSTTDTTASSTIPALGTSTSTPPTSVNIFTIESHITDAETIVNDGIGFLQTADYVHAFINFKKALAEIQAIQTVVASFEATVTK